MARNPVERNFVTRFLLGLAVLTLMYIVGGPLVSMAGPVAGFASVFVGALAAFVLFAHWYARYDASFESE
ncbi:hypothetical protein [Halalkalicoccus jeotgali]|uniref:Uncharacterized protein n=1 Tax=Halalkalicoccus jeotgali (strain DSM 18796 / CECT 7217 / JCM 14584 / KCTC 4019 / B3) TaxID=795797 RepID=D8J338_HALJB|nr:hypothetical protein [Halalkalicoccus jeotgali]ADJ15145.1 hypothetical protein HacjB3_08810 [Halalkalicoccus jeotgali B3]ELY35135.1 hypothetical protein C497_13870 [Halalkalicoccus jeotgali B3]